MTAVEERTSEDGDATGEEGLYRANPGYSTVVATWDERGCVICLEDTKSVQ